MHDFGLIGITAAGFAIAAPLAEAQPLPGGVESIEVLARGVFNGPGFNLPPLSQVTNIVPRLNDSGSVVFSYFDENIDRRIWVDGVTLPVGPFFSTSDPHIDSAGNAVWAVSTLDPNTSNWGVWRYDAGSAAATRLTTAPLGSSGWGQPNINDSGAIAYRAGFQFDDAIGVFDNGGYTPIEVDDGTPYTFFTSGIGFNNAGQISARVFQASGIDGVAIFETGGGSALRIADDTLSPSGATITGFLNGTDLNNASQLATVGFKSGGAEVLRVAADGSITVIADDATGGPVSDIQTFNPVLNDAGWVAFRGLNAAGDEAVFVGDGTDLLEIAAVGTAVSTDAGPGVITGFSGGLDINAPGQVLVNAALQSAAGGSLGRGILRVDLAAPEACACDVNGDTLCDGGDFFAWVSAFGVQAPQCDVNGDTLCDGGDFFAWVSAFGEGC
ncbi:MAG: hypothetical protein AAGF47_03970 [Planctomycetota bacterium]